MYRTDTHTVCLCGYLHVLCVHVVCEARPFQEDITSDHHTTSMECSVQTCIHAVSE